MLDLTVGKPVPVRLSLHNAYVIRVQVMFGDADGYKTFRIGPFLDDAYHLELLEDAVLVLERMQKALVFGRLKDGYQNVEGFQKWFAHPEEIPEDTPLIYRDLTPDIKDAGWPGDPFVDNMRPALLDGYEITYFNEGIEYEVSLSEVNGKPRTTKINRVPKSSYWD